jgi:error-prone DNA polymerase
VESALRLPQMNLRQEVVEDYLALRLNLCAHPMELLCRGITGCLAHGHLPIAKDRVIITGLVITRHRPGGDLPGAGG